jgi:hypothetical protein
MSDTVTEPATKTTHGRRSKRRNRTTNAPRRDQWKPRFLAALRKWPNIEAASEAVAIHRARVYRERKRNPAFAQEVTEAIADGCAGVDRKIYEWGTVGITETEYLLDETVTEQQVRYVAGAHGKVIAIPRTVRRNKWKAVEKLVPNVQAAMFFLRAHKPDMYRDNLKLDANLAGTMQVVYSPIDPTLATGPDPEPKGA